MTKPVEICTERDWTLDEAKEVLPLVRRIFEKHENAIKFALDQQRFFIKTGAPQTAVTDCDKKVNEELIAMGRKLTRLSIKVFGNYFIGFDSGQWYWSWKFNEPTIEYFNGYEENPLYSRHRIAIIEMMYGR